MKKNILILVLIVVVLGAGVLIYDKSGITQRDSHLDDLVVYKLGSMEFSYSKNNVGDFENKTYEEDNIKTIYAELPFKNILFLENYQNNNKKLPALLSIYVIKDANKNELSIREWLNINENNTEYDKQAPKFYKQEDVVISKKPATKQYFSSKDGRVNFSLYELVTLYISYKSDIYEINYYKLPGAPDPLLTSEDIKNSQYYEKIVDQIIKSIKFME